MIKDQQLLKNLVDVACKQRTAGNNYKQPRIQRIKDFEDSYQLKVKKQLKNRFNLPMPILSGFVDHLKSKIDDVPSLEFTKDSEEDLIAARKVTSLWQTDSGDDRGKWAFHDRQAKTLAIFSGRGIMKYWASSEPKYKSNLEAVDYHDFFCEPKGGAILENHLFLGQDNIFKSKEYLEKGIKDDLYIGSEVQKLFAKISEDENKDNQDNAEENNNRQLALGLNAGNNNYVGSSLAKLTEQYLVYKGKRYYLLYDPDHRIAVVATELKERFESDIYPIRSWATHEDVKNFWSKGPLDDMYPVSEAMRVSLNQALDNNQKRNWGQRIFDKKMIDDPSQLRWRPDGLISADMKDGRTIRDAVINLETPNTTEANMSMVSWFDNFMGMKLGLTPGAQGASDDDKKVGIYFGELEQVADRLGLLNKSYRECWAELGVSYLNGLKEHLTEEEAVEIIGSQGLQWEKIRKSDIKNFGVKVSGGNSEAKQNELLAQKQREGLALISKAGVPVNPDWYRETILRSSGYEESDVKRASDLTADGDEELFAEAMMAVKEIIQGKEPNLNHGATTGFMKKIINEATDNESLSQETFDKLIDYAMAHQDIVELNMRRKQLNPEKEQREEQMKQVVPGGGTPQPGANNNINPNEQKISRQNRPQSNLGAVNA